MKVALVAILVVAFAAPGQGQGSDKELGAGGIWAKVIGQSGKIDLAPSPDVSGHADRMRIEIDSLRELDSSGEEVEKVARKSILSTHLPRRTSRSATLRTPSMRDTTELSSTL